MECMADLQSLVRAHGTDREYDWTQHGEVTVKSSPCGWLVIFTYKTKATYDNRWNWFERVSRGLIMNARTGEVVARPFDKFWNYHEREGFDDKTVIDVRDKMDGSLGILYRLNGEYRVATKGSFDSEQALWATQWLRDMNVPLDGLSSDLTLLFEIIYPGNRIVVDYGRMESLVLLAVRDRRTGAEKSPEDVDRLARVLGLNRPQCSGLVPLGVLTKASENLSVSREGWVVMFHDGSRCKIKGSEYLAMHRAINHLTPKRIAEAALDGKVGEIKQLLPEEMWVTVDFWANWTMDHLNSIHREVGKAARTGPRGSRKEFAIWAKDRHPRVFSCLMSDYSGLSYEKQARKLVLAEIERCNPN